MYEIEMKPNVEQVGITIPELILLIESKRINSIGYPKFGSKIKKIDEIDEGAGKRITKSENPLKAVICNPLFTCAAVCYSSPETVHGYVYHAPKGIVSKAAFLKAMGAMGLDPAHYSSVSVSYTIMDKGNQSTIDDAKKLIEYGINSTQIVYMYTTLEIRERLTTFGMNSEFQLGV